MINKLICVCCSRDLPIFKISARYIGKYVDAKNYRVVVPEADMESFQRCDLHQFEVVSEEIYKGISDYLKMKGGNNRGRFGWYFQQFIKISELRGDNKNTTNLIWDADTIPLKKLHFIENGKVNYYQGSEYHKPYFDLISRILSIPKLSDGSFIAQCFPCKSGWAEGFVSEIEARFKKKWFEAIIDNIDFRESCGFSEYEALGSYLLDKHHDEIRLIDNRWHRLGNSLIGGVSKIDHHAPQLSKKYDFIAFECWDTPTRRFSWSTIKRKVKRVVRRLL